MAIDGNYDGKIIIKKGEGISQAIRDELGLTQAECNKLGGVWTSIFEQVVTQNQQEKIYDGGSDLRGATNKNFIVHSGQEIKFTQEIWNNIVQLVNDKLGKNIEKINLPAQPSPQPASDANDNMLIRETSIPQNDINPPTKDLNPPSNIPEEGYYRIEYDNQERITREIYNDYYNDYEYNDQGLMTRRVLHNPDGSIKYYHDHEYNDQGLMTRKVLHNPDGSYYRYFDYEYNDQGLMTREVIHNPDGSLWGYCDQEYNAQGINTGEVQYIVREGRAIKQVKREYDAEGFSQETYYDDQGNVVNN